MLKRAETSHRMDDTLEVFQKRFEGFVKESEPVVEFYKTESLYKMVSSLLAPPEQLTDTVTELG